MILTAEELARVLRDLFGPRVGAHAVALDETSIFASDPLPALLDKALPKRRVELAAGRACAKAALMRVGCTKTEPIGIGPMRAPVWPRGFVGSITHAAGFAAAVAANVEDAASLGVDLEAIVSPEVASSLSDSILRPAELALVRAHTIDRAAAFTAIFSAKEALFKCVAPLVGRYFDFLDAEVVRASADVIALQLRIDLGPSFRAGDRFDVGLVITPEVVIAGTSVPPPHVLSINGGMSLT